MYKITCIDLLGDKCLWPWLSDRPHTTVRRLAEVIYAAVLHRRTVCHLRGHHTPENDILNTAHTEGISDLIYGIVGTSLRLL